MASRVGLPTKRSAAGVATTETSWPARTRRRTRATALYAAIPPVIPTTTRRRSPSLDVIPAASGSESLDDELVLVDLAERHGERLVVDRRVDERPDVVEQAALVQVGVVVVDLAGTLGREKEERVLGVHLAEQVVDGRVDDARGLVAGHEVPPGLPRISIRAKSASSLRPRGPQSARRR